MEKRYYHFEVAPEDKGKRLDKYIVENMPKDFSRAYLQKLIADGHIVINTKPARSSHRVEGGDLIDVSMPQAVKSKIIPEKIKLDIVYEDKDLLVVNKKAGMVVHPAPGSKSKTLVNALLAHCKNLSGIGGVLKPGIVHRLDKDVSGLLVVAKNDRAHNLLAEQFKEKTASRVYYAVVKGVVQLDNGVIDLPIGRSKKDRKKMAVSFERSREALTRYKVLERFDNASLLEITLGTGRTHQIRVHLSYINHPILGDDKYGSKIDGMKRPALHAKKLAFMHPTTDKRVEFECELPREIKDLIAKLRRC